MTFARRPTSLAAVRAARAEIARRLDARREEDLRPELVRRVLVLGAASRSGSSALHQALSALPGVVSLHGENGVFAALHGWTRTRAERDSDALEAAPVSEPALAQAAREVLRDAGLLRPAVQDAERLRAAFAADAAQRLLLQNPALAARVETLCSCAQSAVGRARLDAGEFDAARFWRGLLARLPRAAAPPWRRYDLSGRATRGRDLGPPAAASPLLEEAPFVVARPRLPARASDWPGLTLLLKSSSDSHRLPLVARMFPRASVRLVVLARNPAASISGLMDGWLSCAFHSRDVGGVSELSISGYSRDDLPSTRRWWKFDLPPGWARWTRLPLEEVCARQWLSANDALRRGARALGWPTLELRYEDLLRPGGFAVQVGRVARFAGLVAESVHAPPPVMATAPPGSGKWRARAAVLEPLLARPEIADMSRALGYDPARLRSWP